MTLALHNLEVLSSGHIYLEGPRWYDDKLWVSIIYGQQVVSIDMDGKVEVVAEVPTMPSGLGHLPDGRLLIVSMTDRRILRREADGNLVEHADLSGVGAGYINDMVVDRHGRAYVGEVGYDFGPDAEHRPGKVFLVQPDGSVSVAGDGHDLPNGLAISPDGGTLLVAETYGNKITAYELAEDGSTRGRRDWAIFGPKPVGRTPDELIAAAACTPDGIATDATGALWIADANNHRALRVAEGGEVLDTVDLGEWQSFAVAVGGPDNDTLFVCVGGSFHYDWCVANPTASVRTAKVAHGAPHA